MRWKDGCLQEDDFNEVSKAMHVVKNIMMVPPLGGFTDTDGTTYYTVDRLVDIDEIKDALNILTAFVQ